MDEQISLLPALIIGFGILFSVTLAAIRIVYGQNRFFDYSGLEFIIKKFIPEKDHEGRLKVLPTGFIWVIGVYVALFGLAVQRYENRLDRIEYKYTSYLTNVAAGAPFIGKRIEDIEKAPCPNKPELMNPVSVLSSIFGTQVPNPELKGLLVQTVENWKAKLRNADLSKIDLSNAKLRNADLNRANLNETNLSNADLSQADIREARLFKATLNKARLVGARLIRTDLSWATIVDTDLRGADLKFADLRRADLRKTNLSSPGRDETIDYKKNLVAADPDFEESLILHDIVAEDLDMQEPYPIEYATGADMTGANLYLANLSHADLSWVNLTGAKLVKSILTEARLEGTVLVNADLHEADLHKAVLYQANLGQANLIRTHMHQAVLFNSHLNNANLKETVLTQAVLVNSILDKAGLNRANLIDADLTNANAVDMSNHLN